MILIPKIRILLLVLICSWLSACKTFKPSGNNGSKKTAKFLQTKLKENTIDFEFFTSKIRVKLKDSQQTVLFNADVRMKADSFIWVKVTKFGIEGGRALIRPDSIFIINRREREYQAKAFSFIERQWGIPLTFKAIQNLVLGNPVIPQDLKFKSGITSEHYLLETKRNPSYSAKIWLNPVNYLVSRLIAVRQEEKQELLMEFENYVKLNNHYLSLDRLIEMNSASSQKVVLGLAFSRSVFNTPKNTKFHVPETYTRVD